MDVGHARWAALGSVHRIPVQGVDGDLYLCGLEVIGPDPVLLLEHVDASTVVCLQTDDEIMRRYPSYLDWLASPGTHSVLRLPTDDHLVAEDGPVLALVESVHDILRNRENVVAHCGAGWGRAGVLAVLVMVLAGATVDESLHDLRTARPAAGPQSSEQDEQIVRLSSKIER